MIKVLIKNLVGPANLGRLDYYFKPGLKNALGGAFNGQTYRQRIFREMRDAVAFDVIVETGAFRGTTTEFFAATGLPVYTVEVNPRFHSYSTLRFRSQHRQIHLYQNNSPIFLRSLSNDPAFSPAKPFFYLDAHWYDHLPLAEELDIIFGKWKDASVMIDDFQVPLTDYAYDDYGPGKALTLDYLKPLLHLNLMAFFPAAGPEQETGRKRGSVVLCQSEEIMKAFNGINVLKRWTS